MSDFWGYLQRHRVALTATLFASVGVAFLWQEHRGHILGVLPYLLLLACPLMHIFMHGGHGHHRQGRQPQGGAQSQTDRSTGDWRPGGRSDGA